MMEIGLMWLRVVGFLWEQLFLVQESMDLWVAQGIDQVCFRHVQLVAS